MFCIYNCSLLPYILALAVDDTLPHAKMCVTPTIKPRSDLPSRKVNLAYLRGLVGQQPPRHAKNQIKEHANEANSIRVVAVPVDAETVPPKRDPPTDLMVDGGWMAGV